jgi:hypothetical protein
MEGKADILCGPERHLMCHQMPELRKLRLSKRLGLANPPTGNVRVTVADFFERIEGVPTPGAEV